MIVGVPKETKPAEKRVGLTPDAVRELVAHGHSVLVETTAGVGAGAGDAAYAAAGGTIVPTAGDVFAGAGMIVKVKEPLAPERAMLRHGQIVFTFLHLASDEQLTRELMDSGAWCVAYETVTDAEDRLPLLKPMSVIAGRLAVQAGADSLTAPRGGAGILLGAPPGVAPARVVIIGGGVVGANATAVAVGMGADVTVLDRNVDVLEGLQRRYGSRIRTIYSTRASIEHQVREADLVIGAVLSRGSRAPTVVDAETVGRMRPGSAIVDVAIDQGGCIATSRPTTHLDPRFEVSGVVHYCVANMPGAVPRTATAALVNSTLPYALALADSGIDALRADPHLRRGLNVARGRITEPSVAAQFAMDYLDPLDALD